MRVCSVTKDLASSPPSAALISTITLMTVFIVTWFGLVFNRPRAVTPCRTRGGAPYHLPSGQGASARPPQKRIRNGGRSKICRNQFPSGRRLKEMPRSFHFVNVPTRLAVLAAGCRNTTGVLGFPSDRGCRPVPGRAPCWPRRERLLAVQAPADR